ncbi:MAG: DsrE family protein [Candidatus Competibacter denitrificans]
MANESLFSQTIILITQDGMGSGDTELQHDLLGKYLRLLLEKGALPTALCFYTEGVKLIATGSPFLERLAQLEEKGVRLIVCATCLNYYGLLDQVQVGTIGSMDDILTAQLQANKVITL